MWFFFGESEFYRVSTDGLCRCSALRSHLQVGVPGQGYGVGVRVDVRRVGGVLVPNLCHVRPGTTCLSSQYRQNTVKISAKYLQNVPIQHYIRGGGSISVFSWL